VSPPLVVIDSDSAAADPLPESSALGEVVDDLLLLTVGPASENAGDEVPRLKRDGHCGLPEVGDDISFRSLAGAVNRPNRDQTFRSEAQASGQVTGPLGIITVRAPVSCSASFDGAVRSEARLDNASVHPQCGPVRRRRKRTAHIGHQTRDFLGIYEPLKQRGRPHRIEKLPLEFRERLAPA
jgi:hypothetical protein